MLERRRITIQGTVQGVGFRPFVYCLATTLGITGWVNNSSQGVIIEAEAEPEILARFTSSLRRDAPTHAVVESLDEKLIMTTGDTRFEIQRSDSSGTKIVNILPDLATCPECLREILDPANRRYRYPFTNCTHCGPRFSIIEALPYDRPNTTMRNFVMCDQCRAEYENPLDRRFHAQPNACPNCGPQLALWDSTGETLATRHEALLIAAQVVRDGKILALKGLGGFQLIVNANDFDAVRRLRTRKVRQDKPFAVMYPSLQDVERNCVIDALEAQLLTSASAPIVLVRRQDNSPVAVDVAPGNPYLGVMLPYTPLHHLLMAELGFPIVATSGNRSGEPICTDEQEALRRLGGIADLFLVHDRPIVRPVDDSVVRVAAGHEMVLRRARGYAPAPVELTESTPPVLAVGAHLKTTVAVTVGQSGQKAILSQFIGDLDTLEAVNYYTRTVDTLQQLYEVKPVAVAHDLHPDYQSTQFAREYAAKQSLPLIPVQHHYAHVLACMAEHKLNAPLLGVAWDGTGYGTDGTIWGGEFLEVTPDGYVRVAHLLPFRLPGGEAAIHEPRRAALGLLYEQFGKSIPFDLLFSKAQASMLKMIIQKQINAPLTSSAGRLFDAIAALLGLSHRVTFEGQAAMLLEFAAMSALQPTIQSPQTTLKNDDSYPFLVIESTEQSARWVIDYRLMVQAILDDMAAHRSVGEIAVAFHNTLTDMIGAIASLVGYEQVALTGGCFQNKLLLERTVERLNKMGFRAYWPMQIPPNDGGIALGQIVAAQRELRQAPL